jgi:NADPH-dependent 2,4-dienoyl-CoA reductase/sulfur reductase-like enzyme
LKINVNGKPIEAPEDVMVSAALSRAGVTEFRRSVTGEPRGPVCGMGICFECRATVEGREHVRTCQLPVSGAGLPAHPGEASSQRFDVLIIGAGPAGLAAARTASESGATVAIVDDNPAPGGQIWRAQSPALPKAKVLCGARVVAARAANRLTLETHHCEFDIDCRALILATGARERFLPFPGWTLPHVMGAGGLQALAKSGMPVAGKRVVVAGSGPLLLAVADYLRKHGATVALVAEQADQSSVMRFGFKLAQHPGKLVQAMRLRTGIRYLTACWPVAAEPGAITLHRGDRTWTERCDYVACGFGLVPNTELPALLGCGATVDEFQQTATPGIYAAGEVTGIGGLDLSLVEGEIAGYAATRKPDRARALFGARERHRRFAEALERAFALRPELKSLATDDTLVCRCEDVALGRIRQCAGWREAKLHTRCGMGPCQGRVCGAAVEFLLGWKSESVRPPLFPARIGTLTRD